MNLPKPPILQQAQQTLDILSALSYRTGDLNTYLQIIADGVNELLGIDWTVVTLCEDGLETVLASSLPMGDRRVAALHGKLAGTVIELGRALAVEDVREHPEYGSAPAGYLSYLGIPLRTPQAQVIGTICSLHRQPRRFSQEEIKLVEMFAERAATVLDNYRLWQKERQFHELLAAEVCERTQELRTAQTKLVERERLAAIGEFAAIITHEIRSPLSTINGVLQRFRSLDCSPNFQEYLALAVDEADRLEQLLREILHYAKPQTLQLSQLDLNELLGVLLPQLKALPTAQDRALTFSPALTSAWVAVDPDKLKQVCFNLHTNACEAIEAGEIVHWQVKVNPDQIWMQVHNGGKPIPQATIPRLTDPFYTTKPTGTGLGLALVKRIVLAHEGELEIASTAAEGTTVTVKLPAITG